MQEDNSKLLFISITLESSNRIKFFLKVDLKIQKVIYYHDFEY